MNNVDNKIEATIVSLIRVAAYIRKEGIQRLIENNAISLAENYYRENYPQLFADIKAIKGVIKIGEQIREIEPVNAQILIDRLDEIRSDTSKIAGFPEITGNSLFEVREDYQDKENGTPDEKAKEYGNAAMRQSAILEKIRQSGGDNGKITLKDLTTTLSSVSERTVRYDIQKLCDEGKIDRLGGGGPSTYYVIK